MMTRLTILNMHAFLQAVNECTGAVYHIDGNGSRTDLRTQPDLQADLRRSHATCRCYPKLTLEIPNPKDYMHLVLFTIGGDNR